MTDHLAHILVGPRRLWSRGALAVVSVLLQPGCLMAQPNIVLTSSTLAGIELRGSAAIPPELSQPFGAASVASLIPYAIVVRNTGRTAVTGLDIRYLLTTRGHTIVKNFFYGSTDMADATSVPVIAPGKAIVICPDHLINEQMLSGGRISIAARHIDEMNHKLDMYFRNADTVSISVDSVIRSGGTMSGPDLEGRNDLFQRQIQAYTQFRSDLLAQFSQGVPDAHIIAWLGTVAQQKVGRLKPSNVVDHGAVLQRMLAAQYLALLRAGQRQQAWNMLADSTPEVELHQIINVHKEAEP